MFKNKNHYNELIEKRERELASYKAMIEKLEDEIKQLKVLKEGCND